jgi:DNA (cytosine-5)-methyltransferase 1
MLQPVQPHTTTFSREKLCKTVPICCGSYYNEIDPYAAQWLRNLIAAGELPPGVVDTRDVRRIDLMNCDATDAATSSPASACGPYALERAGWPDDVARLDWLLPLPALSARQAKALGLLTSGTCGRWFHLIASAALRSSLASRLQAAVTGLGWLDLVHADLEASGYAVGAADLCAAGVGAPHIRQRLWFVADAERSGRQAAALARGRAADRAMRNQGRRTWTARHR